MLIRRLLDDIKIKKDKTSEIQSAKNTSIKKSVFHINENSRLKIGDNVKISGYIFRLKKGSIHIGDNTILQGDLNKPSKIIVNEGSAVIGDYCRIRADIIVGFGGNVEIGKYTAINEGTVLRCNEKISIGELNMISYDCLIFDTNTHNIISKEQHQMNFVNDFPKLGRERHKPKTKPVLIGNNCWIGQRAVILKGTEMHNGSVLGLAAVSSNVEIPENSVAAGNPAKVVKYNIR